MTSTELTTLLHAWRAGEPAAAAQIAELVYHELRRRAASYLASENGYHTLSATALVNETYLRLLGGAQVEWECTAHFFVVASHQMRRILIDGARRTAVRQRLNAGQEWEGHEQLRLASSPIEQQRGIDLLALDQALDRLAQEDPRAAQVVELRYFSGLTELEAARVLGLSISQLKRDWNWAKVKLFHWLRPDTITEA